MVFLGSSGFKKANILSMTKATTKNDKNVSTKIVAVTFKNEFGSEEISGKKVCRNFLATLDNILRKR